MTYRTDMRRLLVLAVVLAAGLAGLLFAGAPSGVNAAKADSGFCGVRDGQEFSQIWIYNVRNKCASAHTFRVKALGETSACKSVPGGSIGYYTLRVGSENWVVENC